MVELFYEIELSLENICKKLYDVYDQYNCLSENTITRIDEGFQGSGSMEDKI